MGQVFKILVVVIGLWVGLEFYTQGTQQAFGGLFAAEAVAEPESTGETRTLPQRFGDRVRRDLESDAARTVELIGE